MMKMMIEWLVNKLFWWTKLRNAIFDEVHMYDEIAKRIKENDPDKNSCHWNDGDGWRYRSFDEDNNRFIFNDIPHESVGDSIMDAIGRDPEEFQTDEVW